MNKFGKEPVAFDTSAVLKRLPMSGKTFAPFTKIYNAPLHDDEIARITSALSSPDSGDIAGEAAQLLHRFSVLLEVNKTTAQYSSLDELLPRLIKVIKDILNFERATLFLHDSETGELFSRLAHGDTISEIRISDDAGIAGCVFTTGEALVIADAYNDPRFNRDVDDNTSFRTRNILCVPLRNKDQRIIGVTQLLNKVEGSFSQADSQILAAMTSQVAAVLEHAQMFEKLKIAHNNELAMLEVISEISGNIDLDDLLEKIMSATSKLLGAERSTLFIHDADNNELWSKVAQGMDTKEIRIPCDKGIAGETFTTGKVLNIADARIDLRFNREVDRATGFTTRNILCFPIRNKLGAPIAVIQVLNKIGGGFNALDEKRLHAFSAQIAIALENAALFQDMRQLKNYNEAILKSLSNGVVTLDRNLTITKVNEAAIRNIGLLEKQLVGKKVTEIFTDKNRWIIDSLDYVAKSGGSDYHADSDFLRSDGAKIAVNVTIASLVDIDGTRLGFMVEIEDITDEKRFRTTMARYLAKEVMDKVLHSADQPFIATAQEATMLFSDIRGFTSMTENLGAGETVEMLNNYFTEMVEVVLRHNGLLDKYIGDAIMAVFGAPMSTPDDADNAVKVAIEMLQALRQLNLVRELDGRSPIEIGIGISTGEVVAGNVGSEKRMDYTVIGDHVNLAARLEDANKFFGTSILVSETTVAKMKSRTGLRQIDFLRVRGKNRPIRVYEPLAYYLEQEQAQMLEALPRFDSAMKLYHDRRWKEAGEGFEDFLAGFPDDKVASLYVSRCAFYRQKPPGDDWDGVWDRRFR